MGWSYKDGGPCMAEFTLDSWRDFDRFIADILADDSAYVFRGQGRADWKLQSNLDRLYERLGGEEEGSRQIHLNNFKFAARGRRGTNPPVLSTDNDWWALAQHHGLATPLLDWTTSPFVAAYFAVLANGQTTVSNRRARAVFAINQELVTERSNLISSQHRGEDPPPILSFFKSLSDENARLVSQGGLFTRGPDGIDVEQWMRESFKDNKDKKETDQDLVLAKILIPDKDREEFLRFLNRMNINHLSLFPDLTGASEFCNLKLQIDSY